MGWGNWAGIHPPKSRWAGNRKIRVKTFKIIFEFLRPDPSCPPPGGSGLKKKPDLNVTVPAPPPRVLWGLSCQIVWYIKIPWRTAGANRKGHSPGPNGFKISNPKRIDPNHVPLWKSRGTAGPWVESLSPRLASVTGNRLNRNSGPVRGRHVNARDPPNRDVRGRGRARERGRQKTGSGQQRTQKDEG